MTLNEFQQKTEKNLITDKTTIAAILSGVYDESFDSMFSPRAWNVRYIIDNYLIGHCANPDIMRSKDSKGTLTYVDVLDEIDELKSVTLDPKAKRDYGELLWMLSLIPKGFSSSKYNPQITK